MSHLGDEKNAKHKTLLNVFCIVYKEKTNEDHGKKLFYNWFLMLKDVKNVHKYQTPYDLSNARVFANI